MNPSATLQFAVSIEKLKTRLATQEPPQSLLPAALQLEQEAAAMRVPEFVSAARQLRATVLERLERDDEAIELLRDTRRLVAGLREQDHVPDLIRRQAELHAKRGRWAEVDQLAEEGIRIVESYRAKVSAQYLASAFLKPFVGLYTLGVRAAFELGATERMLARAELSKCRGLIGRASTTPVSGQQLQEAERQFADICARVNGSPNPDALLLERRRVLWDVLEIQRARARGRAVPPEFSLARLQAALAADEAVIYHYWIDATTLLCVALNGDMHRSHLATYDAVTVNALRDYAHYVLTYKRESPQSWLEKGVVRHAARLLPGELTPVLEGKRRLIVSPHRMLHSVPYHVLPWRTHRHLIQAFAVSYAPNLTSLLLRHAPSIPRRVFSVGVRDYHVPGPALSPLPAALEDVAAVESAWGQAAVPVTTLREEQATEAALEGLVTSGELARFSHLHFAVHGANVEGDTPMESRLYLRDSALDGLEISRWRLNAELVVLGACYSGQRPFAGRQLDELPGDDMFGLAAAFFAAGARRMMCALWMADDATAARVNASVHRDLANGAAPEIALQSAQVAEITRGSTVYAWAPYFLSTLGRALP